MKNATVILLLLIFTFNIGGSFLILKVQQYQLRKEMIAQIKEGISESELTQIAVTPEQANKLIWKDKKEFSYQGSMYDVVKVEVRDECTVYHCISDVQETKLIAKYNKELQRKRKDKNNRNIPVKTVKFLQQVNPLPQKMEVAYLESNSKTYFNYAENYSPLSIDILSPPPKQIL